MAGTVTVSRQPYLYNKGTMNKYCEIVTISWVADASDGSVPSTSIDLFGYCVKAITNPGATAPTDNYDIAFGDPADSALDAFGGTLANRDTSNTEVVVPVLSGSSVPVFLCGTYTFALSNNSVNSALGTCILYLVDG